MQVNEAIKHVKESGKKRNFNEAIELIINLKGLDLKKPEHRINEELTLPAPLSKPRKVAVIGTMLAQKYKDIADEAITEEQLNEYINNKNAFKKLIKKIDYFIAEPQLMVKIGKEFGRMLGSRGKMPKPLPPTANAEPLIKKLKNTIKLRIRNTPLIQTVIGYEDMSDEDIAKNYEAVINALLKKLPNGMQNIRSIYIKKTMGHPVKIEIQTSKKK